MAPLHRPPGVELPTLLLRPIGTFPANSRGIDKQICTTKGHQSSGLRVPLIPANQYAKTTHGGRYGPEVEVAGREVELLVVRRIVRDVHFAVPPCYRSVFFDHDGRIVVNPRCTTLKERQHEHHTTRTSYLAKVRGRGSGDRFSHVEDGGVLRLTEIEAVVQLLKHHELGTFGGTRPDSVRKAGDVVGHVGRVMLLNESNFHRSNRD